MREHSTLCKMIEIRRRSSGFCRGPQPSQLAPCHLWHTPEYIIYFISRCAALLENDALSEREAVHKIDEALRVRLLPDNQDASTLEQYLQLVLTAYYPDYLQSLLKETLALAKTSNSVCRIDPINRGTAPKGWPPPWWLSSKMSSHAFEEQFAHRLNPRNLLVPSSMFEPELAEFVVRRQEGDELWTFSSPPETWAAMMGRAGIVLVRNGHPIAHVGTMMN